MDYTTAHASTLQMQLKPSRAKFFKGNKNIIIFMQSPHIGMTHVVAIRHQMRQGPIYVRSQYHGCSSPGDASQGIRNHDLDLVKPR